MRHVLIGSALVGLLLKGGCTPIMLPAESCVNPAPLLGEKAEFAEGFNVILKEGFDPESTSWELAQRYQFTLISVYALGFVADLPDAIVTSLRCEPAVAYIEYLVDPSPPPGAP